MKQSKILIVGHGDLGEALRNEVISLQYIAILAHHTNYKLSLIEDSPNIAINCCGIFDFSPINDDLSLNLERWDRIFGANVKFAWELALNFYKYMKDFPEWKYLINIGSESSFIPHSNSALYCASKSALSMTTKVLAKDMFKDKFCVFQVNPSMIKDTKMARLILNKYPQSDEKFVTKEEVARYIIKLLASDPEFISGMEFEIR